MAAPLLLAALAGGAYYLYTKVLHPTTASGRASGVTSSTVKDAQTGMTFAAKVVDTFTDDTSIVDVFLEPVGTRIVRFSQKGADKASRVEVTSPPGTDPTIKAAALRVFGVRPKA